MTLRLDGHDVAALVFDLDGLLVDSEPVWFEVERAFLARLGHTWTREDADACTGQGTPSTLRVWQRRFGIEVDIDRDTEAMMDGVIAHAHDIPLKPGAVELLDLAARHHTPTAVASSSRHRLIEAVLGAKGLRARFDAVVSGQDVARGKPAPDIFVRAASVLKVSPRACVVLEDALAGVEGGRAAGSHVIAVPATRNPRFAELATHVVPSLHEAAALLDPAR